MFFYLPPYTYHTKAHTLMVSSELYYKYYIIEGVKTSIVLIELFTRYNADPNEPI